MPKCTNTLILSWECSESSARLIGYRCPEISLRDVSTPNHSLENSVRSGGPNWIWRRLPDNYVSIIPVLCHRGWISSNSISFLVILDISGSASSVDASALTLSFTSEPPNSAMTASCVLWLAARKVPREMVGNPCKVLPLGCVFFWRLRWKRHMMMAERLQVFSRCVQGLTLTHMFWTGDRTGLSWG